MKAIGSTDKILFLLNQPVLLISKTGEILYQNKQALSILSSTEVIISYKHRQSFIELICSNDNLSNITIEVCTEELKNIYFEVVVSFDEEEQIYNCSLKDVTKQEGLLETIKSNKDVIEEHIEELTTTNDILKTQNKIIQQAQEEALSGLRYGKLIQDRVNLNTKNLSKLFKDSFQIYKPKNVIGGDLIWAKETKLGKMIAVIDCMGHGVPGAMLAMSVYNFFNAVEFNNKYVSVTEFLSQVVSLYHKSFFEFSDDSSFGDTFDASLCVIDENSNLIRFRGIKRPILIIRNNEIVEYKGSRVSVSDSNAKDILMLEPWDIVWPYKPGDKLYMFSDGYSDQFGGYGNKKYKYSNFKKYLKTISTVQMSHQQKSLEDELFNWKRPGKTVFEQTDDVTVVGIQL
jgi:serine phosphatase RsbU (regulator of sigma subunit)